MKTTLAFDVYGTLIDTHGLVHVLESTMEDQAQAFSNTWRSKQLEYAFRRGLMRRYQGFSECTRQALDYAIRQHQISLSEQQKDELLNAYRHLPAFAGVAEALTQLNRQQYRLFAFSNGEQDIVSELLAGAGILPLFIDVISVEAVQSFKPDPAVYQHFLNESQSTASHTWLISSNSFDVLGAKAAGLNSVWLHSPSTAPLDTWEFKPDLTVSELQALPNKLTRYFQSLKTAPT